MSSRSSSEKDASRFACTACTPMMKKLPSPTASRTTRVWLPGRRRFRAAWRNGNQRAPSSGRVRRTSAPAEQVQRAGDADEAAGHVGAHLQRCGLPSRHPDQTQPDQHHGGNAQSVGRQGVQGFSLPQQQQRLGVAGIEQGHQCEQQRHEQPDGQSLQDRRDGEVRGDDLEPGGGRRLRRQRIRHGRQHSPGDAYSQQRPAQSEQGDLHHVDGQHARGRRSQALQDGGAAKSLLHEDPRDAPDTDAAENDDDESDQAEVVLGPREVALDPVLRPPVGPDADVCLLQVFPQRPHQRLDVLLLRQAQQELPFRAAPRTRSARSPPARRAPPARADRG